MTFILGVTGSIAMGKSTITGMFQKAGIPVWSADDAVHRLYAKSGAAVDPVARLCPTAKTTEGIDRDLLKHWIAQNPDALQRLEEVVHPLVAADRENFKRNHALAPLIVLDIPLLFETDGAKHCDAVLVVTTDKAEQKRRALQRPGMTEEQFNYILSKQMPDTEKRQRADFLIETQTLEQSEREVGELIAHLETLHA